MWFNLHVLVQGAVVKMLHM